MAQKASRLSNTLPYNSDLASLCIDTKLTNNFGTWSTGVNCLMGSTCILPISAVVSKYPSAV